MVVLVVVGPSALVNTVVIASRRARAASSKQNRMTTETPVAHLYSFALIHPLALPVLSLRDPTDSCRPYPLGCCPGPFSISAVTRSRRLSPTRIPGRCPLQATWERLARVCFSAASHPKSFFSGFVHGTDHGHIGTCPSPFQTVLVAFGVCLPSRPRPCMRTGRTMTSAFRA